MKARCTLLAILGFIAITLLSGCASYKLGSQGTLPFKSIYISPAVNESFAPQAQTIISAQIRETFIRDGRVKVLSNENDADTVLTVTLTDYDRKSNARFRSDTEFARTFLLTLNARVSLYNAQEGNFLFQDRELVESTNVYSDNPYATSTTEQQSYTQAEYNAMSRIARDISRQIADEVLSPWPTREEALAAHQVEKSKLSSAKE
ncbi:MAG: LPS assembly lipoprotein LptE [Opitutaceae bacterium]